MLFEVAGKFCNGQAIHLAKKTQSYWVVLDLWPEEGGLWALTELGVWGVANSKIQSPSGVVVFVFSWCCSREPSLSLENGKFSFYYPAIQIKLEWIHHLGLFFLSAVPFALSSKPWVGWEGDSAAAEEGRTASWWDTHQPFSPVTRWDPAARFCYRRQFGFCWSNFNGRFLTSCTLFCPGRKVYAMRFEAIPQPVGKGSLWPSSPFEIYKFPCGSESSAWWDLHYSQAKSSSQLTILLWNWRRHTG